MSFDLSKFIPRGEEVRLLRRWFECELLPGTGFEVELTHLSRRSLRDMTQRCRRVAWNKTTHQREDQIDRESLYDDYTRSIIVGWRGLTIGLVKRLMAITGDLPPDETQVPYDQKTAKVLLENAANFDEWVTGVATDPVKFMDEEAAKAEREAEVKN